MTCQHLHGLISLTDRQVGEILKQGDQAELYVSVGFRYWFCRRCGCDDAPPIPLDLYSPLYCPLQLEESDE